MARVLIVDDEENIRFAFREFLEQDGHEVHMAGDVSDADRLMIERDFDVVVTDIVMPGLKGTDLLERIHKEAKGVQVIMISGEPTVKTASEAVRAGAYDYLAKPVTGNSLQKVVAGAARIKALNDEKERLTEENRRHRKYLEHLVEERTAELSEALLGIIQAMSVTVEKRDPYTAGHQIRVARLARAIAEQMKLEQEIVQGTYLAGIIHDVGKISVPAEVLSKPSSLLDEEFSLIKRHPQTGYDILRTIKFLWPIPDIVVQHHERQDGSGYPNGLAGEEILIQARILAVADTVESMASHRPYRPELGIKLALEEIMQKRGKQYDEAVVDACITLFHEKGYELDTSM